MKLDPIEGTLTLMIGRVLRLTLRRGTGRMKTGEGKSGDSSNQEFYRIRVKGHLKSFWSDWFGGLTVTAEESGDTTLSGPVRD